MGWFYGWDTHPGFPWFMFLIPLFFFGMMFVFCLSGHRGWMFGCCNRWGTRDMMVVELAGLRKEIEELKKKIG